MSSTIPGYNGVTDQLTLHLFGRQSVDGDGTGTTDGEPATKRSR